ncbi:GtrA family protein [Bifidobacterium bohemicum]|nr:GtrA family protein [Bifidobacterium bohemicum]
MAACRRLIAKYPNLWEFIKFNVLSNISTITRFVCVWILTAVFVHALNLTQPFSFLIFNYEKPSTNGLGGFLTFLIAEILAQAVNFVVQMKWVFKSDASFRSTAWKYAILAVIIVVCGLLLPGYVTTLCKNLGWNDAISSTIASVVNTLLAVIISYPLLKWWITPDKSKKAGE